jgi:hypothetical protein
MTWLGLKGIVGAFFVFDRRASKLVLAMVVNIPAQKERATWMF